MSEAPVGARGRGAAVLLVLLCAAFRARAEDESLSEVKVVKLGKLPVRLALAGQYIPVHPDPFGQKWNLQVVIAPVLPKLIQGYLTEPGDMRFGLGR